MIVKHNNILKRAINSNNCPNIILYGHKDIQKLNLLLFYLKDLNNNPLKLIKDKIIWKSNPLYKIFDINCITNKNMNDFFSILNELIHSKNYYLEYNYRIIILNNFNKVSYNLQTKLRVIIEKYRLTTIFILITDKFTSVINPIQSRCLCIRIPGLSYREKREISRDKLLNISYDKRSIIYDKLYEIEDNNEIEYYSEFNEGLFLDYQSIYEIIYYKLQKISDKDKLTKQNIEMVRELSYKVEKYNLYDIHKELIYLSLSDSKYTMNQKSKLIQLFANSEYNYQKSYRSLIHIENLFIQLLHLLHLFSNNKIDSYE